MSIIKSFSVGDGDMFYIDHNSDNFIFDFFCYCLFVAVIHTTAVSYTHLDVYKRQPKGVPLDMVETLVSYYFANKPEDSDWVVLPVANFDAYFGTTSFGRKYLKQIPETILERSETGFGLCRYRLGGTLVIK